MPRMPRIEVEGQAFNGSDASEGGSGQEEDEEEDEENEASCLTFSVDILASTEEMEDVTSHCLNASSVPSVIVSQPSSKSRSKSKRSKSFHTSSKTPAGMTEAVSSNPLPRRMIPRLQLPVGDLADPAPQEDQASPPVMMMHDSPDEHQQPQPQKKQRKRRKSIVNLLFPKGPEKSSAATPNDLLTPTSPLDHGSGGQRLHFRRLSDVICRVGAGFGNKKENEKNLLKTESPPCHQPPTTPSSKNPFLQQLFPHRRRRSSVSHLDHTEQFHETKEEQLEATRRRMSSFPPSDGDESMMILERIHYLSTLEMDEQSRAATPVSESLGPLKLLKKSLCLPSASNMSPPEDANGRSWRSTIDIAGDQTGNKNSLLMAPSPALYQRRRSSPLVPELHALRREALEKEKAQDKKVGDRNVVVFPKRKVEDVPGIFIPSKNSSNSSNEFRISQFLGVKEDGNSSRQRRHSLSDPALLLKFNSPSKHKAEKQAAAAPEQQKQRPTWLANLTPRSPYASTQAVLPFPTTTAAR